MASWWKRHGIAVLALSLLVGTPAAAQPRDLTNPPGTWSPQTDAKVVFPDAAGEYRRTRITEFQRDDWSVNYMRATADGKLASVVTVYFYAWPSGCAPSFAGAIEAMRENNPSARELTNGAAPSPEGGSMAAQAASFAYDTSFDGETRPVTSMVYVYCHPGSRWAIKARSTWLDGIDGAADTAAVLKAIDWPAKLAN